jgi:hypothetical protein
MLNRGSDRRCPATSRQRCSQDHHADAEGVTTTLVLIGLSLPDHEENIVGGFAPDRNCRFSSEAAMRVWTRRAKRHRGQGRLQALPAPASRTRARSCSRRCQRRDQSTHPRRRSLRRAGQEQRRTSRPEVYRMPAGSYAFRPFAPIGASRGLRTLARHLGAGRETTSALDRLRSCGRRPNVASRRRSE